jgi:MarR family transcriptional regulator for hemolysin
MMAALLAVDAGMDRATQVAAHMGVDAAAVTRLLDRLSDAGLIGRCAAPGDRRGRSLSLSAKARALLPALARTADGLDRELAAQLGPGESARLLATLKKLSAAADRL